MRADNDRAREVNESGRKFYAPSQEIAFGQRTKHVTLVQAEQPASFSGLKKVALSP
jgi:hypothetical protein